MKLHFEEEKTLKMKIFFMLYLKKKETIFLLGSNTRSNIDPNLFCSFKEKGLTVINLQLIFKCKCLEKDTILEGKLKRNYYITNTQGNRVLRIMSNFYMT